MTDPEDDYGYFAPTVQETTPAMPTVLKLTYRWSIRLFGERVGFFLGDRAVDLYYIGRGNA